MDWILKMETLFDATDDVRVKKDILRTLLGMTSVGQRKNTFSQNNVRQEVHLHGSATLPDFNNLPTGKLRELLGQIDGVMKEHE